MIRTNLTESYFDERAGREKSYKYFAFHATFRFRFLIVGFFRQDSAGAVLLEKIKTPQVSFTFVGFCTWGVFILDLIIEFRHQLSDG